MVLTDDATLADRLRSLRNLYSEPGRRFYHAELGCNFRLTNLQALWVWRSLKRSSSALNTNGGWARLIRNG